LPPVPAGHQAGGHRIGGCETGSCMDAPAVVPLGCPRPARGLVVTERDLPPGTSMTAVQDWVAGVRGLSA
jgi:hypothetical protein